MSQETILVVGGAGYIGSHMVADCLEQGHAVVVLDDLSSGHRDALPDDVPFYQGDMADALLLDRVFGEQAITAVMHFAGLIQVGESMTEPARYFHTNVSKTLGLLAAMRRHGLMDFIFSSTAAVYGEPQTALLAETHPKQPINPYGLSKWMVEQVCQDYSRAYGLRFIALRYFNAAGAHPNGHLAERHEPETHLIPLCLQVARGDRDSLKIYGADYATADGTCVRDFIHVMDLCSAHRAALHYLRSGGESRAFNVGTSSGYSVREVVERVRAVTGSDTPAQVCERRAGDPPVLVADSSELHALCDWQPRWSDLDTIIRHAWEADLKYLATVSR